MQMQDYDYVITRLQGLVRRAKTYEHSREDILMRVEFFMEDLRNEQLRQEAKMIEGLIAA
jgi:hypothetical protein